MKIRAACLLAGLIALGTIERVNADGTEGLGVPSIPIATGTGIAAGGRGLITQPGVITVNVPIGATIKQVLLYWEGFMDTDTAGDDTIRVSNGGPPVIVNGTLIGGQAFFFFDAWASTFRADISGLGLVTTGVNNLTVDDLTFTEANNGAGVLVIYDDGGPATQIDVRDGNDLAFINFPDPRKDTIPQTFTFAAAAANRLARLDLFFASIAGVTSTGGPQRPNVIEVTVGATTTAYNNLLDSFAGEEWDHVSLPINVPAGVTTVKVQAFSRDDLGLGETPASLDWVGAFFAIQTEAHIGDLVFNDLNANGIQDGGGEVGVNGVTVELFTCLGNVLSGTTVTAGGGLYGFDVAPGDYYVKFSNLPAGFIFSPSTPGAASDPTDSDANPATGVTDCTTIISGENDPTWDAGIYQPPQPAKIGDLVFNDLNANGIQDGGGEVGVDGVTVELFTCVGDVLTGTTVTAGGGLYLFTVPAGNYYVKFSNLPAGFVFSPSTPNVASDPNDSDADPVTGVANCTTLVANETDLTWDAGIYQPAKIGDLVFNDLNANGIQDGGSEVGVNGVTVELFTCVGNVLSGTTVTAAGGLYQFTVPPGDYYVKFSNLPAGFVFSPSTSAPASDPTDSDANPATGVADCTTLIAGEIDLTWDAGIYQPAKIGDLVFNDLNANGIQDGGGEIGVDGVTVQLFTCVGDVLTGTTVTAGGGLYSFTVPAGNYYVKFSNLPAGFVFSPSTPGADVSDPTDSDANPATGVADCTTLAAGEIDLTWDAGIYQPAKIGDLVFNDLNANGIQDGGGEIGVDGVTVQLFTCVGDVLTGTTVTAGGGLYSFTVPAGNYYVKFSNLPAGFVFSPSTPGADVSDPTDSDANPATGVADCTTLAAGEIDLTWDAGIYQPAKIGDLVFNDLNANGIQDGGGEIGVDGVTVQLFTCVGDVLTGTTVTAGGGLYLFTVPPGNYYVKFSNLPAGFVFSPSTPGGASDPTDSDANPATGVADCTTLVANETDLTWDAGIYQPAKIGDLVFNDLNANGIQDGGGEVGVDGVTVQLFTCVGDVLMGTTVTAGGGLYLFTVPPGNYYVKFSSLPAGFVFSPSTPGAASDPTDSDANPATGVADCTTLAAGEIDLTWDAGIYQPAKIGDLVFNDLNANGIQDGGGEVGVDGVTVQLFSCVGDVLTGTTVTAGGGLYSFTVPAGNYYVKFSNLPAGFIFSPSTPGAASDPIDSDANPATGVADCTTLAAGEIDLTWDAGIYQPAKIGDLVFNDLNANGIQDGGGEVGVDGVTVQLFSCVGDVLTGTTVTAGGGLYSFTVPAGNYYVKFSNLPAGFVFSPSTPGAASDPIDSDANPATGVADCTTLAAGEIDLTWDAGIYQPAKIGDLVFNDLNANGIQDGGGEVGVDGVTVQLFSCVGDVLTGTTVTAGGGLYSFTVPAGNYYVKFSNLPAGFVFSPSTPGAASDPIDSDANPATGVADCTTLAAGEIDLTWDAGIYQPAKIGDLVFNDLNANGIQDGGGEVGVDGVTVQLFSCVGDVLTGTTVTAGGGLYSFTVPAGNYYVKFSNLPAGFVFSPSTPGAASDPIDSDANPATGVADCTTLAAGETDLTWDAGIYQPPQPAKIGDLVFNDLNANGIQDGGGEVGVDGVTVELFTCVGDVLTGTTVTAGGGLYLFTVPAGNYYVKFSNLPAGFVFSPSTPGAASDPNDSDANPATGVTDCTTLSAGEIDLTWDAGIYLPPQPAKIGDLVFNDLNANGIQDGGGEVGVDGVTVELFTCVGDVLTGTTVTAGGGLYLFTVPAGNYYVKFSNLPAGFVFSPSTPGAASDPNDSDANPATGVTDCTTLSAGEIDLTWDAGIYLPPQPAKIGDLVFNDLNANGIQDGGGEVGVDGVTVELFTCVGDVLTGTTVTAGGGLYLFTVPAGNYYVKFSNLPAGFVFSPSTPGGASDPNDSDANPATGVADCTTLAAGETDLTWDAGIYQPPQPAKIGDLVFNDLNANGIQDGGGEVGVDGVTVELFTCVGDVLTGTTVTAGGGLYLFTVPAGNYYVKFSNLPAGFVFSPSTPGAASDPTDSDANPATGVADCTTLVAGENDTTWDAGIYNNQPPCVLSTFYLAGNSALSGSAGNIRSFSAGGVTVKVSAFSRLKAAATWSTAYLGSYGGGLGVTDPSEGDGSADRHTVDNIDRNNYVLFEFSAPVVVDRAFLGYVVSDSDLVAWIGTFPDPFNNHLTLSDSVLAAFAVTELSPAASAATRWADLNAGFVVGNALVIAAEPAGSNDRFKIEKLDVCVPPTPSPATIGNFVWNDANNNGKQDGGEPGLNGVKVELFTCVGDVLTGTTTTSGGGLYSFTVAPGDYYVKFSNLPAGYVFSPKNAAGTTTANDSDADPATGKAVCTTLVAGENDDTWDAGIFRPTPPPCVISTFNLAGSSSTSGSLGNIRTFTSGGVTVKVSAFSRLKASASWSTAYLGSYGGGLGVTDSSEGDGSSDRHTVDNIDRNNYVLFEFSAPVVVDRAFLGYVVGDSDLAVWIGTFADPFNNHLTLSDSVLASFGLTESNLASDGSTRWANFNAGEISGNALVIAARPDSSNDQFKIEKLDICGPAGPSPATIANFVWSDGNNNGKQDAGEPGVNGVKVELFTCVGNVLTATATTSGGGLYSFTVAPGDYYVKFSNLPAGAVFSPKNAAGTTAANDSDADPATGKAACTTLVAGENDTTWDAGIYVPVVQNPCLSLTKTASAATVKPFEPVTYTYTACNCGSTALSNVKITDDNGTPGNVVDDFTVGTIATLASGACQALTAQVIPVVSTVTTINGVNYPAGAIVVVTTLPNGDIKVTYLQDFGINDNTYGTGKIGWNNKNFGHLVNSDKLEFRFFAKNGTVPLDLYMDYVSAGASVTVPGTGQVISYPSGYGTKGPFGGDGSMLVGNANNIVTFSTSIGDNLNNPLNVPKKATLTVDSPTALVGGNVVIDLAKAPGGWNHINSYTVVVKGSTFTAGGGFGTVSVPDQHNSPNKRGGPDGMTTKVVDSSVTNTATAKSGTLTATAKAIVAVKSSTTPVPGPCPSPWQTKDIGYVAAAGSASYSGTTFTVAGSGADIAGTADEFRTVYQQANGDCIIVAKVSSVGNTDNGAGAGVMIRETHNNNSKHATLLVTRANGLQFKTRSSTGGSTSTMSVSGTAPYWVRIVRSGSTFTASRSSNGSTWTSMGSVSITMGSSVYIGLAVTSRKDGTLCTSTFDNVAPTP